MLRGGRAKRLVEEAPTDLFTQLVAQARELARRAEQWEPGCTDSSRALDALQDFSRAFSEGSGALHRLRVVRRHGITPRSLLFLPLVFYIRVMLWSPREEPVEDAATSTPLPRPQGRLRVDSARTTTDPTAGAAQ